MTHNLPTALTPTGASWVAALACLYAQLPEWLPITIVISGAVTSATLAYLSYRQATHHDDIAEKIANKALALAPDTAAAVLNAFTGRSPLHRDPDVERRRRPRHRQQPARALGLPLPKTRPGKITPK